MNKRPTLTVFWLMLSPALTAAELTLPALTAQLAQQPEQRSRFVQLKTVAGLSKPLRSTGDVLVVRERGVLYSLHKPLPARYVIGRDSLVIEEAGQQRLLQAGDAPWLRTLGRLLHSMLAGELNGLEQDFHCQLNAVAGGWQLTLTPRREPLSLALKQVQLRGSAQVDAVQIVDRNGDQTDLQFERLPDAALRPDEAALLERLR